MLAILSKFFVTFFFTNMAHALELSCISGKITQVEFGKVKEEVVEYCYNENKTKLLSKSCYQPKCKALNVIKKYKFTELFSQVGKPGFKLCRELKGTPQIIEFYVDKKPYKLDRCLFSDGSFVDTDHLLSQYLER